MRRASRLAAGQNLSPRIHAMRLLGLLTRRHSSRQDATQGDRSEGHCMTMQFRNRIDAGRQLAGRLSKYASRSDVIVLALPRGGVPVGYEVAQALQAPLDVFIVRKLGVPGREELAMG